MLVPVKPLNLGLPVLLILCAACLLPLVHSATVFGTVYDYALNPLPAVISVNTTPSQQLVAPNGTYSLELGAGTYNLTAVAADDPAQYSSQTVAVQNSTGTFEEDFILVAGMQSDSALREVQDYENFSQGFDNPPAEPQPYWWLPLPTWEEALVVILLLIAAAAAAYLQNKRRPKKPAPKASGGDAQAETDNAKEGSPAPLEDEAQVMRAVEEEGGLVTQKQLRKRLAAWSEARVSLVLTSLEKLGRISKIKRGRGNVIRKKAAP